MEFIISETPLAKVRQTSCKTAATKHFKQLKAENINKKEHNNYKNNFLLFINLVCIKL